MVKKDAEPDLNASWRLYIKTDIASIEDKVATRASAEACSRPCAVGEERTIE